MFLTPEETETLTGYKRAAAQLRWLRAHGYVCEQNAAGEVLVARDAVLKRFGAPLAKPARPEPNWRAVQR